MSLTFGQPLALLTLALLPGLVWLGVRGLRRSRRTWLITGLRATSVLLLILALAGTSLVIPQEKLSVVFVVDASDSLGPGGRGRALDWVREAMEAAGPDDRSGLVLFGKQPLVERDVRLGSELGDVLSRPDATATDIPAAMRLALALFPEDTQKRIVLVSDGNTNVDALAGGAGQALDEAARLAAAAGAQVQTHTLGVARASDVSVEAIKAPPRVRRGESFELEVEVDSTQPRAGVLEVLGDGAIVAQRPVELEAGANRYVVGIGAQEKGFKRWQARVVADGDAVPQNDEGVAFTYVESPPRVLIAEREPGEGENLRAALAATGTDVTLIDVARLPRKLAALSEYGAVALVDVPISALPDGGKLLQTYVRDLGKGLVVVGGEESYALGDYFDTPLEAALPVDSRLKNKQKEPAVAMVMAIDKSGSMAASHTGEGGSGQEGDVPKVDVAKEAAFQTAQLLSPDDEFGVVTFDTAARWAINTAPVGDASAVGGPLSGIQGGGGTNIYGGLAEAIEGLKSSKASLKHVILLTDGWSETGDYDRLLGEAQANGITVSTVSAGGGSPKLLRSIAEKGSGTFYTARDSSEIPKIFVRETRLKMKRYVQENEFTPAITAPSPVLKGLASVPSLLGYVGTTPKPAAAVALSSPEQDPVLAQWQYGLGRSVAWTSDAKSRWSANWIGAPEYARLWSQAVGWTLARPSEDVQVRISQAGGRASVEVDAVRPSGAYVNGAQAKVGVVSPDGEVLEAKLTQTAPGRYEGDVPATAPGAYIASVSLSAGGQVTQAPTTGFAVGYSPEYKAIGPNTSAMSRAATLTGGKELASGAEAYAHDLAAVISTRPLWWPLALLALLLLPIEVAVRRIKLGALPSVRATRTGMVRERVEAPSPQPNPVPMPSAPQPPSTETGPAVQAPVDNTPSNDAGLEEASPQDVEPGEGPDAIGRLRSAKQRARRR